MAWPARGDDAATRRPPFSTAHTSETSKVRSAPSASTTRARAARGDGRLLTLLAIMGPGLIVMVGDNDAGGVSTYAQAGQNYGLSLLWTLPLLVPVLIVNQEMVVRLGAVTGVGHARLINERFGRFWGWFSVGDLFILNFLTIATEFIGVSLALDYFGVSHYISVPVAATLLVVMTASGSFRRWERFMFVFVAANFLVIPLAVFSHPSAGAFFHGLAVPGVTGGFNSTSVLLVIAIVGTTVAPWQLFFQQSNIVDKRITPRWINYERTDTVIGSLITVFAASLIIAVCATAFAHTKVFGQFHGCEGSRDRPVTIRRVTVRGRCSPSSCSTLRSSVRPQSRSRRRTHSATCSALATPFTGVGARRSSSTAPSRRWWFWPPDSCSIPRAPLGLITTGVQALAGVLLPSATVFLLLLCNDKEVLGPWVNGPILNIVCERHRVDLAGAVARPHDDDGLPPNRHKDIVLGAGDRPAGRVPGGGGRTRPPASPATTVNRRGHTRASGAARNVADAPAEPPGAPEVVSRPTARHVRATRLSRAGRSPAVR